MNIKAILAIAVVLLFIGVGSAAVVSYLSNQVEADVTVESPFTVEMSLERNNGYSPDPLTLPSKVGGETSMFFIKYTNHANQPIDVQIETLITCDALTECQAGNLPWAKRFDIDHADFEDDGNRADYDEDVEYGITVNYYIEDVITGIDVPLNFEPRTHDRGTALAVVGGMAVDNNGVLEWPQEFPADTTCYIRVYLHHAPNAVGNYTVTTEVQDDKTPW